MGQRRALDVVDAGFERFDEVPSTAGREFGTPFADIFADHDWDFYEVPVEVFAPAQVTVDVVGEGVEALGRTDEAMLVESFGL